MTDDAPPRKRIVVRDSRGSWAPLCLANPSANPPILPLQNPRTVRLDQPRRLNRDELNWLRIGLGFTGTDRRWMFRLGADNVLRICRSWTGHEIYRAPLRYEDLGGPQIAEVNLHAASGVDEWSAGQRFLTTLERLLDLRERLDDVPSTPQQAWQSTAPENAPWPADLPMLAGAVRDHLPFRVRRIRVQDETATIDADIVDVVVDVDAVLLICADGGRVWISHPWRWAMSHDRLDIVNGDVAAWPGPSWGLEPDLATWVAWSEPLGGVRATKLSWAGQEIPPIDNFEPGMPDLTLELVGSQVAADLPKPTPDTATPQPRRLDDKAHPYVWTDDDRAIIDRLERADAAWKGFGGGSPPSVGRRGLQLAAEVLDRGGRVTPVATDEFGDLRIELGDRRILAFIDDHGEPGDAVWSRLIETIGPFPVTPETDRVLADFSIHGPFERNVSRRSGQIWLEIRVRLADVTTAFLDLDNVTASLADALTDAARETHDPT